MVDNIKIDIYKISNRSTIITTEKKIAEALSNPNPLQKNYAKQLRKENLDRERDQPKEVERR